VTIAALSLWHTHPPVSRVLCLGAHADDIEIGCGGTILGLLESAPELVVTWVVWSAEGLRAEEARQSAARFLSANPRHEVVVKGFRDGFLPYTGGQIKEAFEELRSTISPDLIFTHYRHDLHQDHRLIAELTWNTFRDHLILEYEIPKYDGDLGSPNVFVPLAAPLCQQKLDVLLTTFKSQRDKVWFSEELFRSLLRLRGMECHAPSNYAEAFYARKLVMR
jgi:LmbE family N-acetylglucosaminyl deacetylase